MILSMVKISPNSAKRQELIRILLTVTGPTGATPGCRTCSVYEEYDESAVVFLELWDTEEQLKQHIRSHLYTRVLEAMELSVKRPEINYFTIAKTEGLDLIDAVRGNAVM